MRPSRQLLYITGALVFAALLAGLLRPLLPGAVATIISSLWWASCGILAALCTIDGIRKSFLGNIEVQREVPRSLSLGADTPVSVVIQNNNSHAIRFNVYDHYPARVHASDSSDDIKLEGAGTCEFRYTVRPSSRGDASFAGVQLKTCSRWGFWDFSRFFDCKTGVRVYPNFAALARYDELALENREAQTGIHLQHRRGDGLEFHQLREFREGDSLRQIDWRSTARIRKLISRQYQEERDQDIIFLLDCGRRMRSKDGELSHFDHALNAILFCSHIALKQGDAVGLSSFAGENRWIPPVKHQSNINVLLNQVYDLHSTLEPADYLGAAEELLSRSRKRSLVIIVTNLRGEDTDDILLATRVLARHHLVLVASLKENIIESTLEHPVDTFDEALTYAGTLQYTIERQKLFEKLKSSRALIIESLPGNLYVDLVNEYLNLKRTGRI